MNPIYFYIIISTIAVSLISFIGAFALAIREKKLKKITTLFVGLSAGTLLGDSFLHLMPEVIKETGGDLKVWLWLLGGIVIFFILEKIISWRHCHIPTSDNHPHPLGKMNLIGDCLHNFIDGIIIAISFLINIPVGVATTLAIITHEIPQEMGDFGVLIHAGYSKTKALYLNFFSAIIAVLGAGLGILAGAQINNFVNLVTPLAAGGFIYIAMADIIPELHKETKISKSLKQLISILAGMGIMLILKIYFK